MTTMEQKKFTDCFWYLQNQCTKGDTCEFRHSEAALTNPTVCKYWVEGKCTNENCIFRHPSGVQNATKDKSQIICHFFTQGKCTKGAACPFAHSGVLSDLEKKEEELRKIQLETKKEEERLEKLRLETENLEKKKKEASDLQLKRPKPVNLKQKEKLPVVQKTKTISPKERPSMKNGPGTFVKSFDNIMKEREKEAKEKSMQKVPTEKKIQPKKKVEVVPKSKAETVTKTKVAKKKETKENDDESNEKKESSDFGIKSLDDILKEKKGSEAPASSSSPTITIPTDKPKNETNTSYLEELKKKNQNKFGGQSPPLETKGPSPKRKSQENSMTIAEPKKQKVEQNIKTSLTKSLSTDDFEQLDDVLADLEADVGGSSANVNVDVDDFDKQFDELENLVST